MEVFKNGQTVYVASREYMGYKEAVYECPAKISGCSVVWTDGIKKGDKHVIPTCRVYSNSHDAQLRGLSYKGSELYCIKEDSVVTVSLQSWITATCIITDENRCIVGVSVTLQAVTNKGYFPSSVVFLDKWEAEFNLNLKQEDYNKTTFNGIEYSFQVIPAKYEDVFGICLN